MCARCSLPPIVTNLAVTLQVDTEHHLLKVSQEICTLFGGSPAIQWLVSEQGYMANARKLTLNGTLTRKGGALTAFTSSAPTSSPCHPHVSCTCTRTTPMPNTIAVQHSPLSIRISISS